MKIGNQNFTIIDLTQPLSPTSPNWIDKPSFDMNVVCSYEKDGYHELAYHYHIAGIGTHMDAPSHFIPEGKTISTLPLEQVMGDARVIDVSKVASEDYLVSIDDIKQHEEKYGSITENDIVLIHTGWAKYWENSKKYLNKNTHGKMVFPTIDGDVGKYLAEKKIKGLGIDTLSPDLEDSGFPVHKHILGKGAFLLENLTNIDKLPATGSIVIALPPKIEGGAEVNLRVTGVVLKLQ